MVSSFRELIDELVIPCLATSLEDAASVSKELPPEFDEQILGDSMPIDILLDEVREVLNIAAEQIEPPREHLRSLEAREV